MSKKKSIAIVMLILISLFAGIGIDHFFIKKTEYLTDIPSLNDYIDQQDMIFQAKLIAWNYTIENKDVIPVMIFMVTQDFNRFIQATYLYDVHIIYRQEVMTENLVKGITYWYIIGMGDRTGEPLVISYRLW